jgi:hypothetical protein
MNVQL